MKFYRPTFAEITTDPPLTTAEKKFVAQCKTGETVVFDAALPTEATDSNTIRASLIRHAMLGGCDELEVSPKGVRIKGAWITGVLDLEACESALDLVLDACKICEKPMLQDARLGSVMLPGCTVPGLNAHRLTVVRGVLLNQQFKAVGVVDLSSANIGGTLACNNSKFIGVEGTALNCNAMTVGADVFLQDVFSKKGDVNFVHARIKGSFAFSKAKIKGVLDCKVMTLGGGFFWQDVLGRPVKLDLTDAHVGSLRDDKVSWQDCTPFLNGFRYDRIISDMSVRDRLDWLNTMESKDIPKGKYSGQSVPEVNPQPYTQLARSLEATGQRRGAALVRYVRERLVRPAENAKGLVEAERLGAGLGVVARISVQRGLDFAFKYLFGFGHLPLRVLWTVLAIWLSCFALYGAAYDAGQMAPNSDVVLTSADWIKGVKAFDTCTQAPCEMPLRAWEKTPSYQDYETFNRGLYALDLFVPLDALGQENTWAPSKDRGALGWSAYYMRFLVQMSGWVITAIGAAALTGVIGRKE